MELYAEHRIIVAYEIFGVPNQVDDVLTVKLTDDYGSISMTPVLLNFPVITDPGFFGPDPHIVIPEQLFSKGGYLTLDGAVSQYKDLLTKEEKTHMNQWFAIDVYNLGWDPAEWVNDGAIRGIDNYALAHYVFQFTSMGCDWDPDTRTITFSDEMGSDDRNSLKQIAEKTVKGTILDVFLGSMERRAKTEKEAKAFTGYTEAYMYEHTCMLTREYPLNPPFANYPPPLYYPYTNLPMPVEP